MATRTGTSGNDVFVVEDPTDVIVEAENGGFDIVYATVDYRLNAGAYVELLATGDRSLTRPLRLTGNELDQTIEGNQGDNTLYGGGGRDVLIGFGGNDTYIADAATIIREDAGQGFDIAFATGDYVLTAGASVELLATSDRSLTAPVRLTGNELDQTIEGNLGANTLYGGGGRDTLIGFGGNDFYIVDATTTIREDAGQGFDIAFATGNYVLTAGASIELLATGDRTRTVAIDLTGNELDQTIEGNQGSNRLYGGGGRDTLAGLGGDDTYVVDAATIIREDAGQGFDIAFATGDYVLTAGASVELLATSDRSLTAPVRLTGNELDQTIEGNLGANTLYGGGGRDTLIGFGGNDTYIVDGATVVRENVGQGFDIAFATGDYTLTAGASVELLATSDRSLAAPVRLTGNELDQTIEGNQGNNTLYGGGGRDTLAGFGGNDTYVVDAGTAIREEAGQGFDIAFATGDYRLAAGQSVEVLATNDRGAVAPRRLTGNELGQTVEGNQGDNVVNGGGGADLLYGFGGADQFAFDTALGAGNVDRIADFDTAADTILLNPRIFSAIPAGQLSAGAFATGTGAQDADDRIIYDGQSGALFYDADGNGSGAAVQFATLSAGLSNLSAANFRVGPTNALPVAVDDLRRITAAANGPQGLLGNVLTNDRDPEAQTPLSVTAVAGSSGGVGTAVRGTYGTLTLRADGSYTYDLDRNDPDTAGLPAGGSGVDVFNYQITNGEGGTATAALRVTVDGANNAPRAVADGAIVNAPATPPVVTGDVLANDSDPDTGDTIRVTSVGRFSASVQPGQPIVGEYGALRIEADGSYSFTVDPTSRGTQGLGQGVVGSDSFFNYTIADQQGFTASAGFTIQVVGKNDAPDAVDDLVRGTEGQLAGGYGDSLLTNDSDPDQRTSTDPIKVASVNGVAVAATGSTTVMGTYGYLTVEAGGRYNYVMTERGALGAGQTGVEAFNYTVADSFGLTDAAKLEFTIAGTDTPESNQGSEFLVNTATEGAQSAPAAASLANGGFVVSWVSAENAGDIRAQLFDAAGQKVGAEFLVNAGVAGAQAHPSVTRLDTGGFAVAWKSDGEVRAQAFTDAGVKVGSEFSVRVTEGDGVPTNTDTEVFALSNFAPVVTDLAGAGYVVGWSAERRIFNASGSGQPTFYSDSYRLSTQVLSDAGAAVGGAVQVGTYFSSDPHFDIAGLSNGTYVVAAQRMNLRSGSIVERFVDVSIIDQSGARVGAPIPSARGDSPAITAFPDGGFAVTGELDQITFQEAVRVYDSLGTLQGTGRSATAGFTVAAAASGAYTLQTFTSGGEQVGPDPAGTGIRGQLYDRFGAPVGDWFPVNSATAGDQTLSDVIFLNDGRAVVVWQDASGQGGDASGTGIKAQILSFPRSGGRDGSGDARAAVHGVEPVAAADAADDAAGPADAASSRPIYDAAMLASLPATVRADDAFDRAPDFLDLHVVGSPAGLGFADIPFV